MQRKAETGDVLPLPNRPSGNNHKITDWEQFRAFAKSHGDKTNASTFEAAALATIHDAKPQQYNHFKVELLRRSLVQAFFQVTEGEQ